MEWICKADPPESFRSPDPDSDFLQLPQTVQLGFGQYSRYPEQKYRAHRDGPIVGLGQTEHGVPPCHAPHSRGLRHEFRAFDPGGLAQPFAIQTSTIPEQGIAQDYVGFE